MKKIFFNDTATTEIYTLSLHDALPILHSFCPSIHICVDGQKVEGHEESLTTPHEYDLTPYIQPGKKQVLTVRVDNRKRYDMSVNDLAHAYTDATQVKWNGILGDMYIKIGRASCRERV